VEEGRGGAGPTEERTIVALVQSDAVFVYIRKEVVGAEHLGDLDELVVVVLPVEKRLLSKNHTCWCIAGSASGVKLATPPIASPHAQSRDGWITATEWSGPEGSSDLNA